MMNYGYQVVVADDEWYGTGSWRDTWKRVKEYPVADVYWNGRFMGNYTRDNKKLGTGHSPAFSKPDFWDEDSDFGLYHKHRVVWRKSGEYVEFNNYKDAEAWGKDNLRYFDIFQAPDKYVVTLKHDSGYDIWHSSYAPALIASKPKKELYSVDNYGKVVNQLYVVAGRLKRGRAGWPEVMEHIINDVYEGDVYDKYGNYIISYKAEGGELVPYHEPIWPKPDFSGEVITKAYLIKYIYDNGESEKNLTFGSFEAAWDDITRMMKRHDNISNWKIYDQDGELVTQRSELFGQDSVDEDSGEEYDLRIWAELDSEVEKLGPFDSIEEARDRVRNKVRVFGYNIIKDGKVVEANFGKPKSSEKIVSPKYRVVWRTDGTYVEFDNQDEAEAWGKENLTFFDIFHEPEMYVKTWKYDKGYDTWYSSYAPALIASKPKVEFSGHDFSVQLSGKENAVRNFRQLRSYIAANQAGEVDLLIAWEKLTQRLIQ